MDVKTNEYIWSFIIEFVDVELETTTFHHQRIKFIGLCMCFTQMCQKVLLCKSR